MYKGEELVLEVRLAQERGLEATRWSLLEAEPQDRADSRGPRGRREDCSPGKHQDIQNMDQEDNQSQSRDSAPELGPGDTGGTWRVRGYKGSRAGQGACTVVHSGTEVGNQVEVDILAEVDNLVKVDNLAGVDILAEVENLAETDNLVGVDSLAENFVEI